MNIQSMILTKTSTNKKKKFCRWIYCYSSVVSLPILISQLSEYRLVVQRRIIDLMIKRYSIVNSFFCHRDTKNFVHMLIIC